MGNERLQAVILMGPFGCGKTYLGKRLRIQNIAEYVELEPIVYERFGAGSDFDVARATEYIRSQYMQQLSSSKKLVAFESTGITQRPLLLEVMERYRVALVRVCTPKEICLQRVFHRNASAPTPIESRKASEFFDYWNDEVAPTYEFAMDVDGTDEHKAVEDIQTFVDNFATSSSS